MVAAAGRDGQMRRGDEHGLFVDETRMICTYRYRIDGEVPEAVACSNVSMHRWIGHFIIAPPGDRPAFVDEGSGMMTESTENTVELRVDRSLTGVMIEDISITNYTQEHTSFEFSIEIDGDFADIQEIRSVRRQTGEVERTWNEGQTCRLELGYHAHHHYDRQGNVGTEAISRGLSVEVRSSSTLPRWGGDAITFAVSLGPHEVWSASLVMVPRLESDRAGRDGVPSPDHLSEAWLDEAAHFDDGQNPLAPVVMGALRRARHDLAGLRLFTLDDPEDAWTTAAGLPIYVSLYGRDVLTSGWQAAVLGPEMMEGALRALADTQGAEVNDWRDEVPGRMIHEMHRGPLKVLNYLPTARNYGSITTSAFYPVVVSELWHRTGDKERVRPYVEPALRALKYLDDQCDHIADGFYDYLTRSVDGVKHQAWKDSPTAIVSADGRQVEPPISAVEEQGFVYAAKFQLSEVLWWLGEKDDAKRLYREAKDLKERFNEAFWMADEDFFAAGLDSEGKQISAITSNPGHALATGIIDSDRAEATARRLFAPDLFSGWGVRTLSSENFAYNPYSYHRGSVWPVEQGTFALGLMRYGCHDLMHRLCRAQFEAAACFDLYRLPEVFSGHARSLDAPFPAFYPQANSPQAWSASAVFCMIQAMLGLYPYAPLKMLMLDPHLPEWLPQITIRGLKVGEAKATIRFYRKDDGSTSYRVEDVDGTLHVIRQPSPWSLTAGFGERVRDALISLLPGK